MTDIAAGFLFREGLQILKSKHITVVDFAADENERKRKLPSLFQAYRSIFPSIPKSQFDFSGARLWVHNNLTQWLFDSRGSPVAFIYGMDVLSKKGRFLGALDESASIWRGVGNGTSKYIGNMEMNRLLYRVDMKGSVKQQSVDSPQLPTVPTNVPLHTNPDPLRPGYRDVELKDD